MEQRTCANRRPVHVLPIQNQTYCSFLFHHNPLSGGGERSPIEKRVVFLILPSVSPWVT